MISSLVLALFVATGLPSDTIVNLGTVERDLTGDGQPELLRLVGAGSSLDSLDVTFRIESSGQLLFETALAPLTRTVGFDGGRRRLTPEEHRTRIAEFQHWFFGPTKFYTPQGFVDHLRSSAPRHIARIPEVMARDRSRQSVVDSLIGIGSSRFEAERSVARLRRPITPRDSESAAGTWHEIQNSNVTVFELSPGGDAVTAIAWSARDRRFYRLLECC